MLAAVEKRKPIIIALLLAGMQMCATCFDLFHFDDVTEQQEKLRRVGAMLYKLTI